MVFTKYNKDGGVFTQYVNNSVTYLNNVDYYSSWSSWSDSECAYNDTNGQLIALCSNGSIIVYEQDVFFTDPSSIVASQASIDQYSLDNSSIVVSTEYVSNGNYRVT